MQKKVFIGSYAISLLIGLGLVISLLFSSRGTLNPTFLFIISILLIFCLLVFLSQLKKILTEKNCEAEETARKLSVAVEHSSASIVITDKDGIIEYANPSCCKLTGYSSEELIGNTPSILGSEANSAEMYKQLWKDITSGKEWKGEFSNKKKNGEIYWEAASISPIFNSSGDITHFIAVKDDVTSEKKIKQALQYERKRLRTLIDNIPDLIYAKDINARKILANKADVKQMGLHSEEGCLGKDDSAFFPLEEASKYIKEDMQVMKTGLPSKNTEGWKINDVGERRYYNTNKYPLKDDNNNIIGLIGVGRDITDIKLKELELEKLLKVQTKLVELLSTQPADILDFLELTLNSTLSVTNCKVGYILLHNSKNKSFTLSTWKKINIDENDIIDPQKIVEIENLPIWQTIGSTNEDLIVKDTKADDKYLLLNNLLKIENFMMLPILKNNELSAIVLVGNKPTAYAKSDKTNLSIILSSAWERINSLKIENALRESEVRYRVLFENSPDAYLIISNGVISDCNKSMEELLLLSREKIIGQTPGDISPEYQPNGLESKNASKELIADAFEKGYTKFDWAHKKFDGTVFYTEIAINVILLNGKSSIFATIRDISDRKKAEGALKKSERELRELNVAKDKFFSIIAHDLKSPFNALLNLSDMLMTDYTELTEEEKISFIESINEISSNSYNLLENLLEWSVLQSGRMKFLPEKLNLLVEIYPTLRLLIQSAKNKSIEIKYHINKTDEIIADKNMLNTVIRNLISNAIKFTNPNGLIELKAVKKNSHFEILVSDNGVGMDEEKVNKLFAIEQNISTKGTANEKGTGLGLLLCKEMVEEMGGGIWVESEIDKGTTFTFTIPAGN